MSQQPLLSIIIPTKNRYIYLSDLLTALTKFGSSEFEVIIQDNSDCNDSIVDYLRISNDKRLKYFYNKESLSIIENCENAIRNSTGEYLCFIGDDDGVLEDIIDFVTWMKTNSVDSAVCNRPNYYWPDIVHKVHDFSGSLSYEKCSGKISRIDPESELKRCLRLGATSLGFLPHLYQGIVSRRSLEELFLICSSYFPGPSPDMANAVGLSTVVSYHVHIDYPLIISGAGFKSTGGAGARKEHIGRIEDIPFLPKDTLKYWEPEIPKIWTGQTIWAESAIKALRQTGNEDFLKFFNYSYFYASFFIFHSQLIKSYFSLTRGVKQIPSIVMNSILVMWLRTRKFIQNFTSTHFNLGSRKTLHGVENISRCIILMTEIAHLNKKTISNR